MMPSFEHYALFDESIEMLRELIENGLVAVPEQPVLAQPALTRYTTFESEVAERLRSYPCVLLEGAFTKHPLQFERRDSGSAAGTYFVDVLSGPRLRWVLPGLGTSKQPPVLASGSLSVQTTYRDPTTNRWEPASEEAKAAYKRCVEVLKRHMVRVVANTGERVWVGKQAAKAIENGDVLLER